MAPPDSPEYQTSLAVPPILQIVGDGAAGGGTTVVLQLSQELAKQGATVTVASQAGSYILAQAERQGLFTLPLDFRSRGNTLALSRQISRYLAANPSSLVHAHGARAALTIALLPKARRRTLIYTVHGFHYSKKPPVVRHLAMLAERFCTQRATATVFVSSNDIKLAAQDRLLPRAARTQVIYNGAAPAEPSMTSATFDLAFLGRLHFQKNPGILVDILDAMKPLRPSLSIIGSGNLEPMLREKVRLAGMEQQVTFQGEQEHSSALRLLESARIMVLPSRWEGLPVSVIEAMHRGIPVVASDIAGTNEAVADGTTGFLVPSADPAAYADRIARLLGDPALYSRISRSAVLRARELFSIRSQMEAYVSLYASTVSG